MANKNSSISGLPAAASGDEKGFAIVKNPSNKDRRIPIQDFIGGERASFSWDVAITYIIDDLVLDNNKVWKSLNAANLGNKPSENSFWTEVAISEADGITLTPHSIGVFTYNNSAVQVGGAIYFLNVAAPYESTDFAAELLAGDWIVSPLPPQNYYDFITQGTPPAYQAGRGWFGDGSFNFYDNIQGTSIQLGKEFVFDVYNNNGSTLTNGTVVQYDTAVSGVPAVVRAQADTIDGAEGLAIITQDILVGEVGKATVLGLLGLDTSTWSVDDVLVLSESVAGGLTNIEQPILAPCARVLVSDVNGLILVNTLQGVKNITAIGQASGGIYTQVLTTTPQLMAVFDTVAPTSAFPVNVVVEQNTGIGNGMTAELRPASPGASGYFDASAKISFAGSANSVHIFEYYILSGTWQATGVFSEIDLNNSQTDIGTVSVTGMTEEVIDNTERVAVFGYMDTGTSTVITSSVIHNMKRLGIV